MTFTATCVHCNNRVLAQVQAIGKAEVRKLQHHLLSRCRPGEPSKNIHHLGDVLRHYQLTTEND